MDMSDDKGAATHIIIDHNIYPLLLNCLIDGYCTNIPLLIFSELTMATVTSTRIYGTNKFFGGTETKSWS